MSVLLVLTATGSKAVEATALNTAPLADVTVERGGLALASSSGGSFEFKTIEKCFMKRINRIRARHGKSKLRWDKHLGVVGRRHARNMARAGGIWHDDIGRKVTRWRSLGQNTGMGGGCKGLTRAFMHSSSHRSNYLGRWRHVGVGAIRKNGSTFVQQVFESRRDPGNIWHTP